MGALLVLVACFHGAIIQVIHVELHVLVMREPVQLWFQKDKFHCNAYISKMTCQLFLCSSLHTCRFIILSLW